jgi:hypothetical protein
VERGRNRGVTYAVPHATVTPKKIEADLGNLGRIAVTRVPTGRTKVLRAGCLPEGKARVEIDRFEGTVEFHGEEGFTSVDATSVPGGTYSSFCGIPEGGRPAGRQLPGAQLRVDREVGEESSVSLYAVQERPGEKTSISAEVMETPGGEMEDPSVRRRPRPGRRAELRRQAPRRDGEAARALLRLRPLRRSSRSRRTGTGSLERQPDRRPSRPCRRADRWTRFPRGPGTPDPLATRACAAGPRSRRSQGIRTSPVKPWAPPIASALTCSSRWPQSA